MKTKSGIEISTSFDMTEKARCTMRSRVLRIELSTWPPPCM